MIRPSGSGSFWGNWALEAVEASEVAEAAEVNEAGEVSKAWKITTEDFRVFQVDNLRTNITFFQCFEKKFFDKIMKTHVEFYYLFCRRQLRPHEVKKVSNGGSGINSHYSGTHWASAFGRFVKTSGRARSLLYHNS